METLPNTKSCFVCGVRNTAGLQLSLETDGTIVRTSFVPRFEYSGFIGVVHGGILATVLDEIMSWVCAVKTRKFSYCAEMTVRFLSPARAEEQLHASAQMTANRRDRIYLAESQMKNSSDDLVAIASGKYMPIRDLDFATLAGDFAGDPAQLEKLFNLPGGPGERVD